jgi:hypothetical protein
MATYTGSFTIDANDNGNLSSYNMFSSLSYSTNQSMNNNALFDDMNMMQFGLTSFYGGTVTYSFSGGTDWLEPTTVTWTIVDPTEFPLFIYITTENYYYTMTFQAEVIPVLCNTCQFIQLTQCGDDSFYLDLGLADGPYTAFYADNTSGVIWEQGTYSSQAQGGLSMYQWSATAGMFNQYSFYTLTIRDNNGDSVSWTVDGVEYTCATLTFRTTVNVTD